METESLDFICDKENFNQTEKNKFIREFTNNPGNISKKNNDGNTPLHYLCFRGMYISDIHKRQFNSYTVSSIEKVIDIKKNAFKCKNESNETPIHILCYNYFNKYTQQILEKLVNNLEESFWTVKNNNGNTPLHILCQIIEFDNRVENSIKILIDKHPNIVNIKNNVGNTALHYLCVRFPVVSETNIPLYWSRVFHNMVEKMDKKDLEILNQKGKSCFHLLLENKSFFNNYTINCIKKMVQKNKSLKFQKNSDGNTGLHLMAIQPIFHDYICEIYKEVDIKSDNFQNNDGDTPLHLLCTIPYETKYNPVITKLISFKEEQTPYNIMSATNINFNNYTYQGLDVTQLTTISKKNNKKKFK